MVWALKKISRYVISGKVQEGEIDRIEDLARQNGRGAYVLDQVAMYIIER